MGKLLLLFTVVPFAELYLLLWLSRQIGFATTVGLVLVTGLLGALMARAEGLRVLHQWQRALAEGRMPHDGVVSGLLVLVGGVLLVTPGVMTDTLGLALLLPPTRRLVAAFLVRRVQRAIERGSVRIEHRGPPFEPFAGPRRGPSAPREVIDTEGETVER